MDINHTETMTNEENDKKKKRGWVPVVVSIVIVVIGTILIPMLIAGFHTPGDLFAFIGQQY